MKMAQTSVDALRRQSPEKQKKKLLDAKSWERDGALVEAATALRHELSGDAVFEDHNVFARASGRQLSKKLGIKLGAADLKLHAVAPSVGAMEPLHLSSPKPTSLAKPKPIRFADSF